MSILLAAEYEYTYCGGDAFPDDASVSAVAEFRRSGGIFGIVTRRDVFEAKGIEVLYRGEYDFVLCAAGMACFTRDGGFLWRDSFDRLPLERLYKLCNRRGGKSAYLDAVEYCGMLRPADIRGEMGCGVMHYNGSFNAATVGGNELQLVRGVTEFTVFFNSAKVCRGVMDEIESEFGGELICHPFGERGFDVTRGGIDVESGLRRVAEHYGISEGDIRTAGLGGGFAEMSII